tara:strand:+ start:2487 stop:2954 length:468 start_codon:yes stop_codon:yes gene_type:complete
MDYIRVAALLAHPILASALIFWLWQQYSWRKQSRILKGEERRAAIEKHQKSGELILWSGFAVVGVAFLGRMLAGWRSQGDLFAEIWPTSLHGFIGPLGLILLLVMVNLGKKAKAKRDSNDNYAVEKLKHGRAADFIMALVFIHAFLGFLYIFSVI